MLLPEALGDSITAQEGSNAQVKVQKVQKAAKASIDEERAMEEKMQAKQARQDARLVQGWRDMHSTVEYQH